MDKRPLVAIIVLNYNGRDCLPGALQSLQGIDYKEKRLIIVDNNSQDGSFEIAKKGFPTCIFIKNTENLGFAGGMNVGIREAIHLGADYVWLFNNDAEAEPAALRKLVDFLESSPEAAAASPIITDFSGKEWFVSGKISYVRMRAVHGKRNGADIPYQSEYLSGCALLIRCSAFKSVGLLDERYFLYYEDADISLRLRQSGKKLFVVPAARVSHGEQSERENAEKIYHLVYSGLIFFREHTPIAIYPWMRCYEFLRRMKNQIDLLLFRKNAAMVRRAYDDYDRNFTKQ